ncbi:MAG TPA: histidine kinase, partial [Bacteroidia bacterium]
KDGSLWDTIGVKDGLIGNVCEKIIIDGDRCWVSSNKGLSCVTYSGFKKYDIVNYHLKDLGTPSLIQDYFIKDSVLYFASGCMVYTYPLKEQRLHPVPFYVYKLEVNGKMVPIKNNLEFGYEESNIRVHFGALYYNLSGVVKYRYKLLPNDAAWTYTTESSVLFPSLSPGSYSLLLQAQRNDGSWIECKDVVNFSIQKPFWLQWWCLSLFVVLGVSMVTGISYFFYSRKLRRELIQTKIRTRLYSLEMRAVKAQMNPHFIFNSLNSIQHFILAEENENAYKYLSKFSKLVRKLIESNQSENLMLETEVEILTKYLEIESMRFKDAFTYEVKVDPSINRMKKIPHMMIQPFVENAIWHGLLNKKGERSLIIHFSQLSENSIECRIEDNGIGINKAKESIKGNVKEKSLALDFIQERLMLFSRTMGFSFKLSVRDKSDIDPSQTGTEVLITLPLM